MCSIVILRRPENSWPLLVAANRDEMLDRPWAQPARHWKEHPLVTGGCDLLAGGSWLARNDHGVFAAILNREGSLGPSATKRSRGELVLKALNHKNALESVQSLCLTKLNDYRDFNLVIGDNQNVFHLAKRIKTDEVKIKKFPEGLSMLTSQEINDSSNARIKAFLPKFRAAAIPNPVTGDWQGWCDILADSNYNSILGPATAMCIISDWGFGTVSSSLLAFPKPNSDNPEGLYLFASGRPDRTRYLPV